MDVTIRTRPDSRWFLLLALIMAAYAAVYLGLPRLTLGTAVKSYVIGPLIWGTVVLAVLKLPGYRAGGKPRMKPFIIQLALIIGFFQIVLYAIGGLFSGFGKNPSSFTPMSIGGNVVLFGSMLTAMELSRAWIINHLAKNGFLALGLVALVYTVLSIPLAQLTNLRPGVDSIAYVNSTLLPSLAESLLASLLALLAGPVAPAVYRGILMAFWVFCPILPDLSWSFKGLIGASVPIVGLVLVRRLYLSETQHRKVPEKGGSVGGWVVTSVLSVVLIWFAVGIFPIQPAVIPTGSMMPLIKPGDVVLVAKVPPKNIAVGDIIQFRTPERINIVHRVIEIRETEAAKVFITKGDANDSPDDPVIPQNIVGKVVLTVPKVGWLAILIKGFFTG